jgi:hypothetical protein
LVTVILPGATTADPSARFRGFPPIVFEQLTDTAPLKKLLRVVDRARAARKLPPRNVPSASGTGSVEPKPEPAPPKERTQDDQIKQVVRQLRRDARQFGLNFLVGPLTGIEPPTAPPEGVECNQIGPESGEASPWELAHLIKEEQDGFPPDGTSGQLPLELVASWLSMSQGDARLVQSRLKQILGLRGKCNSRFYHRFAQVLKLLLASSEMTRRRRTPPPLIFTTNFGTNLEWNMMQSGVPFTRVTVKLPDTLEVQKIGAEVRDGTIVLTDLNDEDAQPLLLPENSEDSEDLALSFLADALPILLHSSVDATAHSYGSGGDQMSTSRGLSFDDAPGCVLFKYHGSIDVYDSCVVNNEQLFELTRIEDLVPSVIGERLKIAPTVVFGTSFLLTEVQQTAEAVLRVPFRSNRTNRYLVPRYKQTLKDRGRDGWLLQFEEAMRENLKNHASKLNLVEVAPGQESFLLALQNELEPDPGSSMAQSA